MEQPNFSYNDVLRSLEVLFYNCTNHYFEIEEEDGFRKYGKNKEQRPNPIGGMSLFLKGDGIPLTFDTFEGGKNKQVTLNSLEEKIINDFNYTKY